MAHIPVEKTSTNWLAWTLAIIGFVLLGMLAYDLMTDNDDTTLAQNDETIYVSDVDGRGSEIVDNLNDLDDE